MTPGFTKTFVTHYVAGLSERTRDERSGRNWGIDWVIYNLGLARFGKPIRLPFLRPSPTAGFKTKSEAEFGVDLAFLSSDGEQLVIFVLKSVPLTNKSWTGSGFDEDLRKAIAPDLNADGISAVKRVLVILAYNADEEQNGITLFDRFVAVAPPTLRANTKLEIVRWNLSDLVEQVLQHLLTPALLPQQFFGQISYLCAQVADFPHGSDRWEQQLVPNWKRLVSDVLASANDARGVSLVPVMLIILRGHGAGNPSIETGWIDLMEWAAIALWRFRVSVDETDIASGVARFWNEFYLAEIDRFYRTHITALSTEHAIDQMAYGRTVGVVAAAIIAYWHLGRIGLLSMAESERMPVETVEQAKARLNRAREIANWIVGVVNANQSTLRPILDVDHIQLFLLFLSLRNAERTADVGEIFRPIVHRLVLRKFTRHSAPFLDGHNSLENVFEQIATHSEEELVQSKSSFLLLMLLELCCALPQEIGDELLVEAHRRLVLGATHGAERNEWKPIHLMSWIPPTDWWKKVFDGFVDDGEAVSCGAFADSVDAPSATIRSGLVNFVKKTRAAAPFELSTGVPLAALVLASIRHRSPLPPEFWRAFVFPEGAEPAEAS